MQAHFVIILCSAERTDASQAWFSDHKDILI